MYSSEESTGATNTPATASHPSVSRDIRNRKGGTYPPANGGRRDGSLAASPWPALLGTHPPTVPGTLLSCPPPGGTTATTAPGRIDRCAPPTYRPGTARGPADPAGAPALASVANAVACLSSAHPRNSTLQQLCVCKVSRMKSRTRTPALFQRRAADRAAHWLPTDANCHRRANVDATHRFRHSRFRNPQTC